MKKFSRDFSSGKKFESCFGIGEYALDSYKIFVLGDDSVCPKDKELKKHLENKRRI